MSSWPHDYYSDRPKEYQSPPAPDSNYFGAWQTAAGEAVRAKPIVLAALKAAAQPQAVIDAYERSYDRHIADIAQRTGLPTPEPQLRNW